jgi:beta-glucosidase
MEQQIDEAVIRVLETKWDLGLFKDAFGRCNEERARQVHGCPEFRQLAREAAREAIVLLKNEKRTLPMSKHGTIAIIGRLAVSRRDMLGCWSAAGDEAMAASPMDGILQAVGSDAEVVYASGEGLDEAIQVAVQADKIILVLGETWEMNGEAASRVSIRLPGEQRKLAKRILKTGKPCVLVTMSGRPLELTWEDANFPAILHAWALGTEGGRALADVIFGDSMPVGKLTMGFPRSVGQVPMTYREKPTGRPFDEAVRYTSKYLDERNDALYPFGHGLTYGEFRYGAVSVEPPEIQAEGSITVFAEITNIGDLPATETLQLYLRDLVATVSRPLKELRGFERLTLAAGETRRVAFTLTDADLSFPGRDFQPVVEPGEFEVMVGPNSRDLKAAKFVRV